MGEDQFNHDDSRRADYLGWNEVWAEVEN